MFPKASKLPLEGAFWSIRFDANTRLVLVTTRPAPHSRQVALELRYILPKPMKNISLEILPLQ